MNIGTVALALFSIALSTTAQVLLRIGMSSDRVQQGLGSRDVVVAMLSIAQSPFVIAGLTSFGLSAAVWLLVLARTPVSLAYPFVALGIAATVGIGYFGLGERVGSPQLIGILFISVGVVIVGTAK